MAGDDAQIVEGMYECQAFFALQLLHFRQQIVHATVQQDARAVAFGGGGLAARGLLRHDDGGRDAEPGGGEGQCLGGVAGGHGDDAARLLLCAQVLQAVQHAARLEGASLLQQLGLES